MAMMIRSDLDLPTLRIMLDPSRTSYRDVVFQVVRGRGSPTEAARCTTADLGLPESLTRTSGLDDQALRAPPAVLDALHRAVEELGWSPLEPYRALWLEFPSPRGILYVVPWERLLGPLGRCMFRLPNHLVRPQAPGQALEVALCTSVPAASTTFDAARLLADIARAYVEHSEHDVHLQVFTDSALVDEARDAIRHGIGLEHVTIHDPFEAARYDRPQGSARVTGSTAVTSPWLLWILDSAGARSLDMVHLVSHGYLSGDRGAVAMASAPTRNADRMLARLVGAVELTSFLTKAGAWGLSFTSPPGNLSETALRELADSVALAMPALVTVHSAEHDQQCGQLGANLRTVLAADPSLDRPLPASTCWVHPRFVEFPEPDQDELHVRADGSSAFIAGATLEALSSRDTGGWVAAASRNLEMLQARWLPDVPDEQADPAAVTALRNVAELLERHVVRAYRSGETPPGDS